jgi:hypothetical protein
MIKIAGLLMGLGFAAALSLATSSPTLAKAHAKASSHRATSPSYQYDVRRSAPVPPIVRCRHGVWDPYGLRCDTLGN